MADTGPITQTPTKMKRSVPLLVATITTWLAVAILTVAIMLGHQRLSPVHRDAVAVAAVLTVVTFIASRIMRTVEGYRLGYRAGRLDERDAENVRYFPASGDQGGRP